MANGQDIAVYMEGHDGHRGNVLAHVWISKLGQLLSALARLERSYLERDRKQTIYEVVDAQKRNPTIVSLHPVPQVKSYDPMPAVRWSFDQLRQIATEGPVDPRLDAEAIDIIATLGREPSANAYKAFWVNGFAEAICFDEYFAFKAQAVAHQRRRKSEHNWFSGVSQGSVVGELTAVDDEEGRRTFVVNPKVGARRILCSFPVERRDEMGHYLFKVVRVDGLLYFDKDSPHPKRVDMKHISDVVEPAKRFSQMRGAFADLPPFDRMTEFF